MEKFDLKKISKEDIEKEFNDSALMLKMVPDVFLQGALLDVIENFVVEKDPEKSAEENSMATIIFANEFVKHTAKQMLKKHPELLIEAFNVLKGELEDEVSGCELPN